MSPTVQGRAIRRSPCESELTDPFEMLADCIAQNAAPEKRSQILAFGLASEITCKKHINHEPICSRLRLTLRPRIKRAK